MLVLGKRGYAPGHIDIRYPLSRHRLAKGGCAMKPPGPRLLDAELSYLVDLGLLVNDRDVAERLLRLIGALATLTERHGFDERGRCRVCRPTRRWPRRRACTVHEAFDAYRIGTEPGMRRS